jgi:SOS-response transcriptional repressor LexA
VTYFESNRPRQYFPDFIVVARETGGREVTWLAETKGEIRPNTGLKSEAATLWCEKMSRTAHGQWRYLFVQQRKLQTSLQSGVRSLAELAASLVAPRPEPQPALFYLDDERATREAFKTMLPFYSLRAAAGYFSDGDAVDAEGWVDADGIGRLDERMFICRAVDRSMEPTIRDGDYIVLRANPVGTRQGKIVLAQYHGPADPDIGGAFTIKKYSSDKRADEDNEWRHTRIVLSPLNPEYKPIIIPEEDAESFRIVAEFVAVLRSMK